MGFWESAPVGSRVRIIFGAALTLTGWLGLLATPQGEVRSIGTPTGESGAGPEPTTQVLAPASRGGEVIESTLPAPPEPIERVIAPEAGEAVVEEQKPGRLAEPLPDVPLKPEEGT